MNRMRSAPLITNSDRPQAALFDFGGVLLPTAFERRPAIEARFGLLPGSLSWNGQFDPENDPMWVAVEAGAMPEREYWLQRADELSDHVGREVPLLEFLAPALVGPNLVRPEADTLFDRLDELGVIIGVLSNDLSAFTGPDSAESFGILRRVHHIFDAAVIGVAKPDPLAYRIAVDSMGVDALDVVFIDDLPVNVEGARAAGLRAVHFRATDPAASFAHLLRELAR